MTTNNESLSSPLPITDYQARVSHTGVWDLRFSTNPPKAPNVNRLNTDEGSGTVAW
jgi:hypothetical protein